MMKKTLFALLFVFCTAAASAQHDAPLMLIFPGREVFFNFPASSIGNRRTMTVFLPEDAVPLKGIYPTVYILGAGPQDAERARQFLEKSAQKAVVVGVEFSEKELAESSNIIRFISSELVPYIDTNYRTYSYPESRVIVGRGATAKVAAELLAKPRVFDGAVLINPPAELLLGGLSENIHLFVRAERETIVSLQSQLAQKDLNYGPDYVYSLGGSDCFFENLPLAYLLAPKKTLSVRRAEAQTSGKTLELGTPEGLTLNVTATLANKMSFDYLPQTLKMSPPFLRWEAEVGTLFVVPGAEPGSVKISGFAGPVPFQTKIKLKKQQK